MTRVPQEEVLMLPQYHDNMYNYFFVDTHARDDFERRAAAGGGGLEELGG
jgi:prepilin-type processing-associated H-X9-DG protein